MWCRLSMVLALIFVWTGGVHANVTQLVAPSVTSQRRDLFTKPESRKHKKRNLAGVDLTIHRVAEAVVQIPSVPQASERGQLSFDATIPFDPNVFIGAAAFWVVTMMAAHSESVALHKILCGPTHIGPALMNSGFGLAFAATF